MLKCKVIYIFLHCNLYLKFHKMGRKPKRKPKSQAEFASREEYEHRLCYAYVECGSYGAVAKQFGTHAQTVKRA